MIATTGQRIEELRKDVGLSQQRLAAEVGITRQLLSMIEIDKRVPSLDVLKLLSERLNVSVYYLLTGVEDQNRLVCEETGLSNETINVLVHHNKVDEGLRFKYMQSTIDILVAHPAVLLEMGVYLNVSFGKIEGTDDNGEYHTLSSDDLERIQRLKILDSLKEIRNEMKGEKRNEEGKR